eukprot:jgi/Botrbrau1/4700/Bobra.0218s0021.1
MTKVVPRRKAVVPPPPGQLTLFSVGFGRVSEEGRIGLIERKSRSLDTEIPAIEAAKRRKAGGRAVVTQRHGRGRPKGAKNKPKPAVAPAEPKRKRGPGRPKGSKNKRTVMTAQTYDSSEADTELSSVEEGSESDNDSSSQDSDLELVE